MKLLAPLLRLVWLTLLSLVALQLFFLLRIALMAFVDPSSTSFERSEIWRLASGQSDSATPPPASGRAAAGRKAAEGSWAWRQSWVDYEAISPNLGRAVIASEDGSFTEHPGVEWDALQSAWDRNQKAKERAAKANERLQRQASQRGAESAAKARTVQPRLRGGSTISQQLAKNLFLGPERQLARKAQELLITFMLEALLDKRRILEIYLNHVEWGEGIFGAQAAAQRYFGVPARQLGTHQAARLAVMLPAPKRFERQPASAYLLSRTATIEARMASAVLPRQP